MDCIGGTLVDVFTIVLMWTDRQTDRGRRGKTKVHTVISFVKSQYLHTVVSCQSHLTTYLTEHLVFALVLFVHLLHPSHR